MGLATRHVSWSVGGRSVVDDVTLDVTPGTVVGLLGPNGSGKSSLLRLLAGVRAPSSGQVLLDGEDLGSFRRRDVARRIAVVAEALERVELTALAGRSWHTLSGGERQRVHIARALAQGPQELLLDEPTNHLDVHHQLDPLSLVRRLAITSVVALHDLNLAAMFCDRLVVLRDGRVVAAGTPSEVLTRELVADVYRVRAVVPPEGPGGVPSMRFEPGAP